MPSDRNIELAGLVLSLDVDSDDRRACLDWFFGEALPSSLHQVDLRVTIRTASGPVVDMDGGESVRQGPTRRWESDTVLTVRHDLAAVARVTDDELAITLPPGIGDPWRAIRHLLFSGLSWWLERRGLVLLHGAMIARRVDAALVLGATGHGKSTAAFAAQTAGWDLCSDDLVIVGFHDARLQGFGVPKRPSIERRLVVDAGKSFELLDGDERSRVMLDPGGLAIGWRTLRMLVLVDHHDGDGIVRSLGHADALDVALEACLESERPAAVARQFKTLVALAGLPAFELLHAVDLPVRLQRAADLIDEAWTAALGGQ